MRKLLPTTGAFFALCWLGGPAAVRAQDARPFEDVKPDHWAYQALTDLQARHIITGYPDQHFNGQRTLTRYEFAVALKRAFDRFENSLPEKGDPGAPGQKGQPGAKGAPGPSGRPGISREELDEIQRLSRMFQSELASLGLSIKDIQAKLDGLSRTVVDGDRRIDRMAQLNGDFFFGIRPDKSRYGVIDYSAAPRGARLGRFDDIPNPHELRLETHASLPGGVQVNSDIISSSYPGFRGTSFAGSGVGPGGPLNQVNTVYSANIGIPIGGSGSRLTVGRYREQITPLTYYRPDHDAYSGAPWYGGSSYVQDGFELATRFGSVTTRFFGGSLSSIATSGGAAFNSPIIGSTLSMAHAPTLSLQGFDGGAGPGNFGGAVPGQVVGFHGGVPLFNRGELGLTVLDFTGASMGTPAANTAPAGASVGNVAVYGANVKLNPAGRFMLSGEAAKSVAQRTLDTGNDDSNGYLLNLGYNSGPIAAAAGYQYYDPSFAAPGYWNKIGSWYNPTNVQGPFARVGYTVTNGLQANIGGDFLTGARNRPGIGGLTTGSSLIRGLAGVKYHFSKQFELSADYEGVLYDLSGAVSASGLRAKPVEQYITLGAGLNLSGNTILRLAYQIVNVQDAGNGFGISSGGGGQGGGSTASVFTTQLAIHF